MILVFCGSQIFPQRSYFVGGVGSEIVPSIY